MQYSFRNPVSFTAAGTIFKDVVAINFEHGLTIVLFAEKSPQEFTGIDDALYSYCEHHLSTDPNTYVL